MFLRSALTHFVGHSLAEIVRIPRRYLASKKGCGITGRQTRNETMSELEENGRIPVSEELPPALERVLVTTPTFKCAGYIDAKGVWRHEAGDRIKEVVVAWEPLP